MDDTVFLGYDSSESPEETPMMECGHAANAALPNGDPACAICMGMDPKATQVMKDKPDLSGREAECLSCHKNVVKSSPDLPFFEHRPDKETDGYYCGCMGWD